MVNLNGSIANNYYTIPRVFFKTDGGHVLKGIAKTVEYE